MNKKKAKAEKKLQRLVESLARRTIQAEDELARLEQDFDRLVDNATRAGGASGIIEIPASIWDEIVNQEVPEIEDDTDDHWEHIRTLSKAFPVATSAILAGVKVGSADHSWIVECLKIQAEPDFMERVEDIRARGIQHPIVVGDDGRLWDGHHRVAIAVYLNIPRIPVTYCEGEY